MDARKRRDRVGSLSTPRGAISRRRNHPGGDVPIVDLVSRFGSLLIARPDDHGLEERVCSRSGNKVLVCTLAYLVLENRVVATAATTTTTARVIYMRISVSA